MTEAKAHDDKDGERIAKVIARAGLASRREAEAWIAAGRVAVNGAVIRSPALNVTGRDRVSVDDKPLPAHERTRLFLYHKPRGLLTAHADPQGRPTIFQRLPENLPRLISVGRLDFNTEGLILLTNDGALARVLELPATGWLRRYRVRAHGSVTQATLDGLRAGVTIDGIRYREIEATLERVQGSNLWLTFAIREGKNREVRSVLGHLGLSVTRLIRVSFGPFALGDLAEGALEEVRTRVLREQLGARVAALSGADFSGPVIERTDAKDLPRDPGASGNRAAKDLSRDPDGRGKRTAKDERPTRQRKSAAPAHSWRAHSEDRPAKKLHRRFHGSRRDDEKPRDRSAHEPRASLLTDRKGRTVAVERQGEPPRPEPPAQRPGRHRPKHVRRAPDRAAGVRPRRPRGR